jgi:preprotein translocase subunit SecY
MATGQLPSVNKAGLGELFSRLRFVLLAILFTGRDSYTSTGNRPQTAGGPVQSELGTIFGLANMFRWRLER